MLVHGVDKIHFPGQENLSPDFSNRFEVGDVIFYRKWGFGCRSKDGLIDSGISILQKVNRFFRSQFPRDTNYSNTIHVALVVEKNDNGSVLIAEAMPCKNYQLRIVDFTKDSSTVLQKNEKYDYEIFRCKDSELAKKTSEVARRLCKNARYLGEDSRYRNHSYINSFSFFNGFRGIEFSDTSFGRKAKERAFLSIFDEAIKVDSATGSVHQGETFFCSHFVSRVFQEAIASEAFKKLPGSEQEQAFLDEQKKRFKSANRQIKQLEKELGKAQSWKQKIQFRKELIVAKWAQQKIRKEGISWSKRMARNRGSELEREMKYFKLDAKVVSPHFLRFYAEKETDLFQHVFDVLPPE